MKEKDEIANELEATKDKLDDSSNEISKWKAYPARQLDEGFNSAVDQVSCLYPDLDLEQVTVFEEVRGGKLVIINQEEASINEESAAENSGNAANAYSPE